MAVRPVVVAVDGSEESLAAVEWAAMTACLHDTSLLIAAAPAAPPRIYGVDMSEPMVADARRGMAARALEVAIRRADAVVPGLDVGTVLLSGLPPFAVAAAAQDATMLVTGARGVGGFAAMVLGSVSRYAATHAACPVVVVRDASETACREVVVGIQDAEQSSDALVFALEEARSRGAELIAVHAWSGLHDDPDHPAADLLAMATANLAEALEPWHDKYPAVQLRSEVVRGHPAWVLASYSARAELVVLGRSAGPGGYDLTSIQLTTLDHARGPIAIVPTGAS
ncbi:MAG TPA: universal stress protein [Streptosporangiaceae bacterium]|nr:universal stress protein [Streptosporangiaceae bacterium]